MNKRAEADDIIRSHALWSMGAGLIPLPLFDVAAVTAIQVDMLQQLAKLYGADYSQSIGKTFISAIAGSTLAKIGASVLKVIPGIGTVLGGLSMTVMSGASTYGVGEVARNALESGESLINFDVERAKEMYNEAFERGKQFVSEAQENDQGESGDVFAKLEKLGKLRDDGVISPEDFEAQKSKLLDRL